MFVRWNYHIKELLQIYMTWKITTQNNTEAAKC